jgi:hypothetical protein
MGLLGSGATAALGWPAGQAVLGGSVPRVLSIVVTASAQSTGLDFASQVSARTVATVTAYSNSRSGYIVTVSSQNQSDNNCVASSGPCFYSATTLESLPFSLFRNSVQVSFSGNTGIFSSSESRTPAGGDQFDAKVSYDATTANLGEAADYGETLVFSISAQ